MHGIILFYIFAIGIVRLCVAAFFFVLQCCRKASYIVIGDTMPLFILR